MASRPRTADQIKNPGSRRICQERFSCNGSKAEFECVDCGTRQCSECEIQLHISNPRFVDHDRAAIQQLQLPASVQPCGMWCNPINPAEFSCIECKGVLCGECNRVFHRGKLTKHHRRPIATTNKANATCINVKELSSNTNERSDPYQIFHEASSSLEPKDFEVRTRVPDYPTSLGSSVDEFQSIDSVSSLPVLQKLESPPEFHPESDGGHPTELCNNMEEMSSNEFRSLEEDLERVMEKHQTDDLHLDSYRSPTSDKSDALLPCLDHFKSVPDTGSSTRGQMKPVPQSRSKRQAVSPQTRTNAPVSANPESNLQSSPATVSLQPVKPLRTPPAQVVCDVAATPSAKDAGDFKVPSKSKSNARQKAAGGMPNPARELTVVRPVASVMGTSIGSSEGDGETDSPGSSFSRKPASTQGAAKWDDVATPRRRLKSNETAIKYKPGFLLVNENENLQVKTAERFAECLGCPLNTPVKVVSIFGNTGDGKSHSLNHTFFGGQDVFRTSPAQDSCTIGIWVAYDPATGVIVADTEGLQGVSTNENQRTRLLLKVLAISDVVVYRTRADRLHRDLFQFLGDASKAYSRHFNQELKAASERGHLSGSLTSLGPAVIVFQETTHTVPLGSDQLTVGDSLGVSADAVLRERFKEYGHCIDAFSCVQYIGTQTITPPTDFRRLRKAILGHVRNGSVRSPRPPAVVFNALKVLNDKFSGDIDATVPSTFPDEYFTCMDRCLSCDARCVRTMNHSKDSLPHDSESRCRYQHQYDNQVFTCKTCYEHGEEVLVVPKTSSSGDTSWFGLVKYAWSGYVLECPNCGIIYRSRQHWYGNLDPEQTAVRTEIRHVWPGGCTVLQGTHNAARRVVDGLSSVIESVGSVSARPTQVVTQWMTDQIAPAYWQPNAEITVCHMCEHFFGEGEKIHHCRACGEGFCDDCSTRQAAVPERGWGDKLVRVCERCYEKRSEGSGLTEMPPQGVGEQPVTVRKVGEVVQSTFSVLGNAIQYPLGFMVDAARPAYWVPDGDITVCSCCLMEFSVKMRKHHCRACGKGVCSECSEKRRPVPSRGWDEAVRVCDKCDKKQGQL